MYTSKQCRLTGRKGLLTKKTKKEEEILALQVAISSVNLVFKSKKKRKIQLLSFYSLTGTLNLFMCAINTKSSPLSLHFLVVGCFGKSQLFSIE